MLPSKVFDLHQCRLCGETVRSAWSERELEAIPDALRLNFKLVLDARLSCPPPKIVGRAVAISMAHDCKLVTGRDTNQVGVAHFVGMEG